MHMRRNQHMPQNSIVGTFCGVLIGVIMVIISVLILVNNESTAIQTVKRLDEGLRIVQKVDLSISTLINSTLDDQLVYVNGQITSSSDSMEDPIVTDNDFEIAVPGIRLYRNVEMFQWVESRHEYEVKGGYGEKQREFSYSYSKKWVSHPVNSDQFYDISYKNPVEKWSYESKVTTTSKSFLGTYNVDYPILEMLHTKRTVPLNYKNQIAMPTNLKEAKSSLDHKTSMVPSYHVANDMLMTRTNLEASQIGDIRIGFQVVPPMRISIIAKQSDRNLIPFPSIHGGSIFIVSEGNVGMEAMFLMQQQENTLRTWIFRLVGFLLQFFGLLFCLNPILVILSFIRIIPVLGNIFTSVASCGIIFVALIVSLSLSLCVISISWVAFRPHIAYTLAIVGALVMSSLFFRSSGVSILEKLKK